MMPIQVQMKPKTEPKTAQQHDSLVPLRVTSLGSKSYKDESKPDLEAFGCEVGDIVFMIDAGWRSVVVNASRGTVVPSENGDKVFVLRAYDVQSIILTNDTTPAPVL